MNALAEAIARDILRERPEAPDLDHCLPCSRAFSEGKGTGANARFCSMLCQNAFDAGYVHREPKPPYSLPSRGDGFLIDCTARAAASRSSATACGAAQRSANAGYARRQRLQP
jgi:hypothetical protein